MCNFGLSGQGDFGPVATFLLSLNGNNELSVFFPFEKQLDDNLLCLFPISDIHYLVSNIALLKSECNSFC